MQARPVAARPGMYRAIECLHGERDVRARLSMLVESCCYSGDGAGHQCDKKVVAGSGARSKLYRRSDAGLSHDVNGATVEAI